MPEKHDVLITIMVTIEVDDGAPVTKREHENEQPKCDQIATALTEPAPAIEKAASDKIRRAEDRAAAVGEVLCHYLTYHPHARPGKPARRRVADRMGDGYSVDELKRAIDGCHMSPYHCGMNITQTKYQSIHLIFRDAEHVLAFMEHQSRDRPVLSEKSQRTQHAADSFVNRLQSNQPQIGLSDETNGNNEPI